MKFHENFKQIKSAIDDYFKIKKNKKIFLKKQKARRREEKNKKKEEKYNKILVKLLYIKLLIVSYFLLVIKFFKGTLRSEIEVSLIEIEEKRELEILKKEEKMNEEQKRREVLRKLQDFKSILESFQADASEEFTNSLFFEKPSNEYERELAVSKFNEMLSEHKLKYLSHIERLLRGLYEE